jgi:hypothetical protein
LHTQQLLYAKVAFEEQFAGLYEDSFQDYFQKLMQYRYPTFMPVRTHGNIGDLGADGICPDQGRLYACYGPQSPNDASTTAKFWHDLASALKHRKDQFSIFVFVHNDKRGMHPRISSELANAKGQYPGLSFEQMGKLIFWREFKRLDLVDAEELLGRPIPIDELVYGISLADLEPLLIHLGRTRSRDHWSDPHAIPERKLEFNSFSPEVRAFIIHGMRFAKQIKDYYDGYYDPLARDDTAAAFKEQYLSLHEQDLTPDEIFQELFVYVVGNRIPDPILMTSTYTVLSYFFQTCDIFEEPPAGFVLMNTGEP